jgi:hypothetical protein
MDSATERSRFLVVTEMENTLYLLVKE